MQKVTTDYLKGKEPHTISHKRIPRKLCSLNRERTKLQSCTSLLLITKSVYIIKFNAILTYPYHVQNCFLSVPFPQTFYNFLYPYYFVPYFLFHSETTSSRTRPPFFPLTKCISILHTFFAENTHPTFLAY